MKNDFHFFVPADIEKASKSGDGKKEKMKIKGIASTRDRDSDDEVLDTEGFVLDFFLKSGFLNWHHRAKENPAAIVGEPTFAENREEGLYIEGELYEDSDLAKSIYDLAKTLKKRDSSRRLGFSIEGKVLERDLVDERKIKRALITGCAITPTPKNPHTIMDVVKGKDTSAPMEFESIADPNGGDTKLIVDLTRPDGTKVKVDENFNIKIEKTLTTDSGAAIIPEHVEGSTKKQENFTVTKKNSKLVNKSKAFAKISNFVGDVEKAKLVYSHLKEKFNDMKTDKETSEVTQDDIYKALETLGIEPTQPEEIQKSDTDDGDETIEKGKSDDTDTDADEDVDVDKLKKDVKKAKEDYEMKKAKLEKVSHPQNKGETQKLNKGEEVDEIEKSEEEEIEKSKLVATLGDEQKGALETIVKAFEGFKSIKDEVAEIKKAVDENKGLDDERLEKIEKSITAIESFEERLDNVESKSQGRKSITTKNYIEKSFPGGKPDGSKELSITKNRNEVLNVLSNKAGIEKGEINEKYADALLSFEASGQISKGIVQDLRQNDNILLTR